VANVMTRGDSLREYLTGAGSDGGAQTDPAASLGNFRSSSEWGGLGIRILQDISNLSVDFASGGNNLGVGTIELMSTNTVRWADNGRDFGLEETVLPGQSKIIESVSPGAFLRVSQAFGPFVLAGGPASILLTSPFNNIFGESNVTIAQAGSGISQYRASIIKNVSSNTIENLKRWVAQLATQQISDSVQLGGSGSGTITTTGNFNDWPPAGYAHIFTSGEVSREIVYYSSRTSTSLTVPAAGRHLLGSSAAAGAATDIVRSVPGVAVAINTTGVTAPGSIQTIANETTAPAAVTWNTGISAATGLNIGSMSAGQQVGIWFWRQIPAGAIALPSVINRFGTSFDGV
jgi:hypothetical protein